GRVGVERFDAGRLLELSASIGVGVGRAAAGDIEQTGFRPAARERGRHLAGSEKTHSEGERTIGQHRVARAEAERKGRLYHTVKGEMRFRMLAPASRGGYLGLKALATTTTPGAVNESGSSLPRPPHTFPAAYP